MAAYNRDETPLDAISVEKVAALVFGYDCVHWSDELTANPCGHGMA